MCGFSVYFFVYKQLLSFIEFNDISTHIGLFYAKGIMYVVC